MSDHGVGVRERATHVVRIWYAVLGGIGAWTVHLVAESSLVRYTCNDSRASWVMHAVTVATAAATVLAMWLSYLLVREGADAEDAGTPLGRTRFLGLLGLLVGGINLVLIVAEGSYVFFLHRCA